MRTVAEGMQCHGFPMRVGVSGLQHMVHSGMQGQEASIVGISNNYLKFARYSAMAASHAQAHGANGKLSACSSQMFGILVSCGCCACS